MVGILCNASKRQEYIKYFHPLFRDLVQDPDASVIIFTLSDIDLESKTVTGILLSGKSIELMNTDLPGVIFNLSIQHKNAGRRIVRRLMELENTVLVNEVNRFKQWMMIDMLSSCECFKNYLLPYNMYNDEIYRDCRLLVLPEKGSDTSKLVYVESPARKQFLLAAPELLTFKSVPVVVRVHMQRGREGKWDILSSSLIPQQDSHLKLAEKLDAVASQAADRINRFIPALGICFADFVFDKKENPYLLGFGGWDNKLLHGRSPAKLRKKICENFLDFYNYIITRQDKV